MDSSIIAVRTANGSFVPVLDSSSRTRRRLVLTTIRDDQTSVQIDLYRAADEGMESAEYVGSLMIENIEAAVNGQAEIVLLLGVDEAGNLNATATDKNSGEYQSLSVSLEALDQEGGYDLPDFELSDEELTLDDLSMDEEEIALDESAASLSLDDVTLEEDLSLDIDSEPATDTLAADVADDKLSETSGVPEDDLPGLEEFSEESVSLDESLADEPLDDIALADESVEAPFDDVAGPESELASEELPDLGEGMVEADLGEEDFSFDELESEPDEDLFGSAETLEETADDAVASDDATDHEPVDEAVDEPIDFGEGPDFAIDDSGDLGDEIQEAETRETEIEDTLSSDEFERLDSASEDLPVDGRYGEAEQPLAPRRSNAVVFVGYLILALAALGVLTYLVFRLLEGPPSRPLQASFPLLLAGLPARARRRRRSRRAD